MRADITRKLGILLTRLDGELKEASIETEIVVMSKHRMKGGVTEIKEATLIGISIIKDNGKHILWQR